ncbi:MAG TPA: lactate racemase domain-containing protein [Gaiellaceae bacterium]|nr:lactate racemase domain-containing protein [Gaiellaceae bacterium]
MPRLPLLSGSGVTVVNAPDDAVVLRPHAPAEVVADVGAAVAEALRFPLEGVPLDELVRGAARVTIVVELPSLPIPGATIDPRQAAVEGTSDELVRAGVPSEAQTLLVAGGLAKRPGPGETGLLVRPEFRRRFRGRVVVHDVEDPELVELGRAGNVPLRVNRALVDADAVVVVTAAETVVHGGPAALLGAAGVEALRAAGAWSLLETAASQGWQTGLALERALAARVPVMGVSVVLNHPRLLAPTLRDYPFEIEAAERLARSPLRRAFGFVPRPLRARVLRSFRRELTAAAAFAGPPAVAHAEALVRAIAAREAVIDEPVDALVVGIPPSSAHLPREAPNPLMAAHLGLGLALRLWRDDFPVADGGTAILLHPLRRRFAHPGQQPYRVFFQETRFGREPDDLREAERAAAADPRALAAYREGRACHPLLPFADWAACQPALARLGAVLVAGCRDSVAARQLGLVPTHGFGAALEMARGRGARRIGVLLAPPYFPVRVAYSSPR